MTDPADERSPARKASPVSSTPRETKPVVSTKPQNRADKAGRAKGKVVVLWCYLTGDGLCTRICGGPVRERVRQWIAQDRADGIARGGVFRIEIPAPRAPKGRGR